jgi:hypothetical protein
MASVSLFVFFVLSHLLLLHSAEEAKKYGYPSNCPPFCCGKLGSIEFPFSDNIHPDCGFCIVNCDEISPTIQLGIDGRSYDVIKISQSNTTISVKDQVFQEHLNLRRCELLSNLTFPKSTSISFEITTPNQTLFKCKHTLNFTTPRNFKNKSCGDYNIYYSQSNNTSPSFPSECSIIQLTKKRSPLEVDLFALLTVDFDLEVHVSDDCISCYHSNGQCLQNKGKFYCATATATAEKGMQYVYTLIYR